MNSSRRLPLAILLTALLLVDHAAWTAPEPANPPVKVMSFNIRYGAANDGTNSWPQRRSLVLETIQAFDPDLLGLQEVLGFQAEYLQDRLPGYAFHGVGREDGVAKGEYVPVMYKTERFELVSSGHFWLSETPEIPGSKSWDSSLPRMLSWVLLRDHEVPERPFVFANVHFDHRGPQARLESARLIRQRAAEIQDEYPVVLTGDFNTTEDDPPYAVLVKGEGFQNRRLIDTYRAIHPERSPNEASFSRWIGVRPGSRIDWIVHSPEFNTLNATINYTQEMGRYPSDHYPVEAVLRLR
jgi:endonuclease/exonuclease/phosphatase family metal-dependent hydrolase